MCFELITLEKGVEATISMLNQSLLFKQPRSEILLSAFEPLNTADPDTLKEVSESLPLSSPRAHCLRSCLSSGNAKHTSTPWLRN